MGMLKYISDKLYSNDKEVALVEDNGGIESGDGYIKYSDGTLIKYGTSIEKTTDQAAGAIFRGVVGHIVFDTTVPFIADSIVTMSLNAATDAWAGRGSASPTQISSVVIYGTGSAAQGSVRYHAIGRWK